MNLEQGEISAFAPKKAVIVLVLWGNRIVLGFKDPDAGCLGAGCWVSPGGKIEPGEKALDTAVRELPEEVGVCANPQDFDYCAIAYFYNYLSDDSDEYILCQCPIYRVKKWSGQPTPQPNEKLIDFKYYPYGMLPTNMMSADQKWLPPLLLEDGKLREFHIHYNPKQSGLRKPVEERIVRKLPLISNP